jgi:hypothetical protein
MSNVESLRPARGLEVIRPRLMKLTAAIREARRQRARPPVVVHCPGIPESQTIAVRSRFGPMCSACGAVIDRSPSHITIPAEST